MKLQIAALVIATVAISSLSSCLPLAAGAAVGYVAAEEGYKVQSPITKEKEAPPSGPSAY